jgi:hypothetical protein
VEHDFSKNPTSAFRIMFKRRNGALGCAPQAEFSGVSPNALPQNSALGGTPMAVSRSSGPILVSTILAR